MSGAYRFWDTPDGQDFFKKEYWLFKRALPIGAFWAWWEVNVNRKPFGIIPVTVRYATAISQPIIAATIYNASAYMLCKLRKKDDPLNNMWATFPTMYYICKRLQAPGPFWFIIAIPASAVMFHVKQYKLWYPYYNFYREPSTYRDNRDNTIFADFYSYLWLSIKDKNWVTLEEAIASGEVQSKEEAKEKRITNYKSGQARGLVRTGDGSETIITIG